MRTDPLQMAVLTNQAASTWVQMAITEARAARSPHGRPHQLMDCCLPLHARARRARPRGGHGEGPTRCRPSVVNPNQLDYASRLRDEGLTIAEIVEKTGITRTSLYRHLLPRPPIHHTGNTPPLTPIALISSHGGAHAETLRISPLGTVASQQPQFRGVLG